MTDSHADPQSTDNEPQTPVWLPALGFALFILGGVAWAVTPRAVSATPPPLPAPSVVAAPAPPPSQAAPPAPNPAQAPSANPPQPLQRPGGPVPKQVLPGAGGAPGALPVRPLKKHP
jgi:hypothetical protein